MCVSVTFRDENEEKTNRRWCDGSIYCVNCAFCVDLLHLLCYLLVVACSRSCRFNYIFFMGGHNVQRNEHVNDDDDTCAWHVFR